ncbi:MAG: hypothetical protein JWM53_1081 [bacterium]|nr:hypothetical protein [bacterium]
MDNVQNEREPYEPPTVEDVPVRAEEQVLAGCKVAGQGGPNTFPGTCVIPGACMTPIGS